MSRMFKKTKAAKKTAANFMRCDLPEWAELEQHASAMLDTHIHDLFARDAQRFEKFSLRLGSLLMDYSKQRVSEETIRKLCNYAKACDLPDWREKMFKGDTAVNPTENRAALHTALRAGADAKIVIDRENIIPKIQCVLDKMHRFSDEIRSNGRFTHIVNIGIGGSDLGPAMAYKALKPYTDQNIKVHFVSNLDSSHLTSVLKQVDAKKTLFIIVSKSFTTMDTMVNAQSAKEWLCKEIGANSAEDHFVAVSQNVELAKKFGVKEDNIYPLWDWVGGRFSLWSSVGLSLCLALGFEQFRAMLDGAKAIDDHFNSAVMEENLPVIMALIGMWNRNFLGYDNLAIIPYIQNMSRFPTYMQQLDMESNGKSTDKNGQPIPYDTSPVIFGAPGTNAQHSFFQHFHQGTTIVPCDFIACIKNTDSIGDHQTRLLASIFAQSEALMEGKESDDPNKRFEGNRPSTTILLDELTPYSLGMLIALYEHKIFVQGILWNINSFDQCGVELGKVLANQIIPALLEEKETKAMTGSTKNLIEIVRKIS